MIAPICPLCRGPHPLSRCPGWLGRRTKRRRECTTCGYRWSTVELSAEEVGKLRADGVRLIRVRNMINEGRP